MPCITTCYNAASKINRRFINKKVPYFCMALIQINKENITGIMVDGYMPDVDILKSLAVQFKKSKTLSRYNSRQMTYFLHSLRNNNIKDNSLYRHFDTIKDIIIYRSCPIASTDREGDTWKLRCYQKAYTIGKNRFSMEGKTKKRVGKINSKEISEILKREFDNIRINEPDRHYLQNTIIYQNISRYPCSQKEGCRSNWVNQMHFDVKPIESYLDFPAFQKAWSTILEQMIDRYKSVCNDRY